MSRLVYLLVIISFLENVSEGNVRLVCPVPISLKSDHQSNFCDQDAVSASKDVTIIQPGLFTVTFEETKFQPSSPFRISLLDNSRKDMNASDSNSTFGVFDETRSSCLLLDHIPHNNHALITKECTQKANDYPLGVCNGSTYHITVRVPDVVCEDCILMLQQVVANQEHQVCDITDQDETTNSTSCIIFTSCARVRIRPTVSGAGKDMDHCSDYLDNLSGDWPYRPQDVYQTDKGAVLTLDLLHNDLNIEIPSGLNLGPIERIEVHHDLTKIWNVTVAATDIVDKYGTVEVTWESLTKTDLDILKDGKLVLNIVGSERSMAAEIVYNTQHFSEGRLSSLHDLYSETGWLISYKFLGPHAEDPAAAVPWGQCAPDASYYMAFLQSVDVTAHGILGMTVLENRAYITAVLHVDKETIQTIRIKGPDLVDIPAIEINIPNSFDGVVQAAFDITEQISYLNTVRFLKTVEVETDKEDAVLVGDLEEGMYTVLRDEAGHIHGMGAFQFTKGQWLRVEAVMNDLSPVIKSAWLHGPGSELVDLSRETIHCTQAFCCLDAMVHEVTSELLLHLMKGQVVLHVEVSESTVSGEVLGSPLRYCQMVDGTCDSRFHHFTMNGLGIEQRSGGQDRTNSSIWTVTEAYVLDRTNMLHFCVQVDNLNMAGRHFADGPTKSGSKIDTVSFEPLEELSNNYIACFFSEYIPVGTTLVESWERPSELTHAASCVRIRITSIPLKNQISLENNHPFVVPLAQKYHKELNFVIKDVSHQFLSQDLPNIFKGECTQSKIHEVGKDKGHWSLESAPFPDIYAVAIDRLRFIFAANTTLFLMSSKEALINCNFASAKELIAVSIGGVQDEFYYTLNQTGSLYFADLETCNTTQALKLIVHVVDAGVSQIRDNDELCGKSVYSIWRDKQLQKWEEPEVSGPVLIGLVIGLSSAGAFLLWQGIRLKRIPDGFRSNSDNVFVRF